MFKDIIIFFVMLIGLLVIFKYTTTKRDGFVNIPAELKAYNTLNKSLNTKTNELTSLINLTGSSVIDSPDKVMNLSNAINGISAVSGTPLYNLDASVEYNIPTGIPSTLKQAKSCESAVNTCNAFDDPEFANNCGMSFDTNGMGTSGNIHTGGGLYILPDDKRKQLKQAQIVRETGSAPYDAYRVYQPTLGKSSIGKFALTKDQCVVVKERVDCEMKQTFSSPNCTQCYTSQKFSRVGPEISRIPFKLFITGNGILAITSADNSIVRGDTQLDANKTIELTIPGESEGKSFDIALSSSGSITPPIYLSGYIEGNTARGTFKVDLKVMIQSDKITNSKPRLSGSKTINGFRCMSFIPGTGKNQMRLACLVPFSFINTYDSDILNCDNGPVITKETSAIFLESDPCFGKANAKGNYKLECLQERWVSLGGDTQGTGYPNTQEKANAIQRTQSGEALSIDTIIDNLLVKFNRARTGLNENGIPLSIAEWNDVSMWALNIPITSPCDGLVNSVGPISKECATHLYQNRGAGTRIGATYTSGSGYASINEPFENIPYGNEYNKSGTWIDPNTKSGLEWVQKVGSVSNVKQEYDRINRIANNNDLPNNERKDFIKAAYGVNVKPVSSNVTKGPHQVFWVGPGYDYTFEEAPGVCAKYDAVVASPEQLIDAHKNGANWCASGWVTNGRGRYPIVTDVVGGCANNVTIAEWTLPRLGVNCYGPKPAITTVSKGAIAPFNSTKWDQPKNGETIYSKMKNGYLSGNTTCFSGLTPEQAQRSCTVMGKACAGISISKFGTGCFMGNLNGGKINDANSEGYIKIPMA